MANSNSVTPQVDIAGIPTSALSLMKFGNGLLRAASAEDVDSLAVMQVQALGSCFISNGPWLAKLPDHLRRAPSARLERLGAWVGCEKGDTSSFLSQTSGGQTGALLCWILGNLLPGDEYGHAQYNLCQALLPREEQIASPRQLQAVCNIVEGKLGCLGFGCHYAHEVTRIRQCFLAADTDSPPALTETPTHEDMCAFLVLLRDALQEENSILSFCGVRCAGVFVSVALSLCPEDVAVHVQGELIHQGLRNNVLFSITASNTPSDTHFRLEKVLNTNTSNFSKEYIVTNCQSGFNRHLRFPWDKFLSAYLDMASVMLCTASVEPLKLAVAVYAASVALAAPEEKWFRVNRGHPRSLLGSAPLFLVEQRLEKVLCRPFVPTVTVVGAHDELLEALESALPLKECTCTTCKHFKLFDNPQLREGTHRLESAKTCPVFRLFAVTEIVTLTAFDTIFIEASSLASTTMEDPLEHVTGYTFSSIKNLIRDGLLSEQFHRRLVSSADGFGRRYLVSSRVCTSSFSTTSYPSTLEFPSLQVPRFVQYNLIDGQLRFGPQFYSCITCEKPRRGLQERFKRPMTRLSLQKGSSISPSSLGEHTDTLLTLRPAFNRLQLRCLIRQGASTDEVDFDDCHIGMLRIRVGKPCNHNLATAFHLLDGETPVKATSTIAPLGSYRKDAFGYTLTWRSAKSQFLCCTAQTQQLYQGDCYLPCAVAEAKSLDIYSIIGGSPSSCIGFNT